MKSFIVAFAIAFLVCPVVAHSQGLYYTYSGRSAPQNPYAGSCAWNGGAFAFGVAQTAQGLYTGYLLNVGSGILTAQQFARPAYTSCTNAWRFNPTPQGTYYQTAYPNQYRR